MSGLLAHIEDAAERMHTSADSASTKARMFAREHGLPVQYSDVSIQFIGARGIPSMDVGGAADPYFHANVDDRVHFVSSVQVQTLDPVWNEVWKLKNVPSHATLFVKVLDKDDGTITDDYIGKFDTTVSAGAKEIEIAGPLFHRTRGSFWLKIDCTPSSDANAATCSYLFDGPIRYTRHYSPTVGRLTHLNDERLYSTWKMTLRCVRRFFGDATQHWNVKYPAAQRIFSDTGSFAVRSGIMTAHAMLYARSTSNGFGVIEDARDTLKILHAGDARAGAPAAAGTATTAAAGREAFAHRVKPAVYTYVIAVDDDTFRFSETGAAFFVDFASKHALHSNCAQAVRYSGEFHPRPAGGWAAFSDETPDSSVAWELVIDNNSGTYAPDKTLLPALRQLLQYNFPGFAITALDREDPELTTSREACRAYALQHRGVREADLQPHAQEGEVSLAHEASKKASQDGASATS